MPHQEYAISYSSVVRGVSQPCGSQGLPEAWGAGLHACAHLRVCLGASFALLGLKVILREQLAGHVVGGHSVTHLDALKMPLSDDPESAHGGDRGVQTEVWCPQQMVIHKMVSRNEW